MKFIKAQSQNPKQLLQLFIGISIISFLLITGICAFGIHSISKKANIQEAERDSVMFSKVFLEHEGRKLYSLLKKSTFEDKETPSLPPATATTYYSLQAGSFSIKSGALQKYNELLAALVTNKLDLPIRVEKIGKYYTVRLGSFSDKTSAETAKKTVAAFVDKPIVVLSSVQQDRIIVSSSAAPEVTQSEEALTVFDTEAYQQFDKDIRSILGKMTIVKIKIFSNDGIIKYSTDTSIVNIDDSKNLRLQNALKGNINSSFNRKDSISDVAGEEKNDLDVVETYLPVIDENGEIWGAFEVYMDITRYRHDVRDRLIKSVFLISLVLISVFGIFILLMRAGTNELQKIQNKLENLSATDGLTGLFNRRYIFDRLEKEFERIHGDESRKEDIDSVGCIMADIDHFKGFNDQYGHHVGDLVLQHVSKRILDTLRPYDIAGRYGGEEFLIILPNSTLKDSEKAAKRIWQNIRSEDFVTIEGAYHVTLSLGVSCLTSKDDSVEDAVKRADDLLYKAKENGRDQVYSES